MKYCSKCGKELHEEAVICTGCGCSTEKFKGANNSFNANASPKSRLVAILLCFFLGVLGVHRFYVGKVGTGLLWLFTCGGFFGIGYLVDIIMIACGSFTDKEGKFLTNWDVSSS